MKEREMREVIISEEDVSLLLHLGQSPGKPEDEEDHEEEEEDEEAEVRKCAAWTLLQIKYSQQYLPEEEDEYEEEEQEEEEEEDVLELLPRKKKAKKEKIAEQESKQKPKKEKKILEVDDSEETLAILRQWNQTQPKKPPTEIVDPDLVGVCSKLMRKQLTGSDLKENQCRLMLVKKEVKNMMCSVFEKSERVGTDGFEVSVYGRDGEVYEMMFKMWNKNTVPVLTSNVWNKFVADYGLMKHSDFLTIWMFRHKESGKICFAVDNTRFDSITKRLSPRISKRVFNPK